MKFSQNHPQIFIVNKGFLKGGGEGISFFLGVPNLNGIGAPKLFVSTPQK